MRPRKLGSFDRWHDNLSAGSAGPAAEQWLGFEMGGQRSPRLLKRDAHTGTWSALTYAHMWNRVVGAGLAVERTAGPQSGRHIEGERSMAGTRLLMTSGSTPLRHVRAAALDRAALRHRQGGACSIPASRSDTSLHGDHTDQQWGFFGAWNSPAWARGIFLTFKVINTRAASHTSWTTFV